MENEIIYEPVEKKPKFGFAKPQKEWHDNDFKFTCLVINNLLPTGNVLLCVLWYLFLIGLFVVVGTIDICLFLILRNLLKFLWSIISETASSLLVKIARVGAVVILFFIIYIIIKNDLWQELEKYFLQFLQ